MRLLTYFLLATVLLLTHNAARAGAFSDAEIAVLCEPMVASSTSIIRANDGLITYKYSRSSQELTNAVRQLRPIAQQVGGTTAYKSDYTLKIEPVFAPAPIDGKYCYRLRADLELAKSPVEVSIASEYNDNGRKCSHEAILEHEMKHVQVYQSFMRYLSKEFRRQFDRDLDQIRITDRPETVANEINRTFLLDFKRSVDGSLKRIQEINSEVDSPEEYERVRTACLR
jgi:hypothetical protein